MDFEELIRAKGLNAAEQGREERKATVLAEQGLDMETFTGLQEELADIDREFREACARALSQSSAAPVGAVGGVRGKSQTQEEWVEEQLEERGGSAFGPLLYDAWEEAGGNRQSIQNTISKMIRAEKIRKGKWEKRGKDRGSWLHLRGSA